jgi:hypothetical protein
VSDCSLLGNQRTGILGYYLREGRAGDYIANQIVNCTIAGGGNGMEFEQTIVANVIGCSVYHAKGVGYYVHSASNSISITGCRTFQITGTAVVVDDSHEFNCAGNIFCWSTEDGIVVRQSNWGTIVGNNVIDNGSYNPGGPNFQKHVSDAGPDKVLRDGIRLESCRGWSVTGNALFNWSICPPMNTPIRETGDSSDNVVAANNVNYYDNSTAIETSGARTGTYGNLGWGPSPHNSHGRPVDNPFLQSFRPEVTDRLIDEDWELDAYVEPAIELPRPPEE